MEFSALGPLRVVTGEGRLVTAPMLRRLLGVLLIRANAPVPAETLIGALWDEPQTDVTAQRLRLLAFRLRKELGDPERLKHQHGSYVLRVLPGELDVERFDLLRREAAETTDKDRTVALLREAVDLWRGEPYADLTAIAAVGDEALRLTEQRLAALEELYAAELDRGEGAAVIADLSDAAARYPFRERFHALLMIALHRGGRQAEALEAYQAARRHLVDELGLEPGAELRRIEAAILAGETPGAAPVARRRPLTPAQLPAGISTFAGRRDELRRLDELLGQTSLIVVNGTAGCGKTTLAVHWARAVRDRFPDGQLYVDLRGYSADRSVTPAEALAGFLRALGVPGDQLPPDEAQRTGLYRSLLAERRVLVVLDNAADAPQVRPLLTVTGGSLTVVTSRAALGGLAVSHDPRVVELAPMAPPDSLAVLRAVLGDERVDRESEAAARLVTLCGGLPLPLRIAAANLSGHTEAPINRLVSELDSAERLSELAVDGDPDLSVRNAFAVSYDALQPAAQLVFRRLGLFPGPELTPAIAAGLTGQGQATCARLLRELRMAHLLERSGADRYRLHDLLRLYAAERAEAADSADERRDAVRRVLASYLQVAQTASARLWPGRSEVQPAYEGTTSFGDAAAAADWLEAERANLLALVAGAGPEPDVWRLVHALRFHTIGRDGVAALAAAEAGLDSALVAGDRGGEARMRLAIGSAWFMLGRYPEARQHIEQALQMTLELADQPLEIAVRLKLASARREQNDVPAAIGELTRVLAVNTRVGDLFAESITRVALAMCCRVSGDLDQARVHAGAAVGVGERLGSPARIRLARWLLAELDLETGDLTSARARADELVAADPVQSDRDDEAYQELIRGRILDACGETGTAREVLTGALAEFNRMYWRSAAAEGHRALSEHYERAGDHQRAADHTRCAAGLFEGGWVTGH